MGTSGGRRLALPYSEYYNDASSDDTLSVASTFGTVDTETTLHSIDTADMPLIATHHIEIQQEQRNVSKLEIQHAIKHGEVYALAATADGRARYGIADRKGLLVVITDASLMSGITAINCTHGQQRWTRMGQLDEYISRNFGAELTATDRRAVKEGIQAAVGRITQLESQGSDDSDGEDSSDEEDFDDASGVEPPQTAPEPEPQGSDRSSSEEDGQSDEDSEEDDSEPEPELEPELERGTLEYMAREVITQLVGMRSAIVMDATVVSLAAVVVKGWDVKRDALCDAVYNKLPDGWSVTGQGKHGKVHRKVQVNIQEAIAKINAPIKSMVKLQAFDVLTTSHLLAEPGSQALKRCFSNVSEFVAIAPFSGRHASGLRAVILKHAGAKRKMGLGPFVQALRKSWVFANNRAPIERVFGAVADRSLGPTVAQVNLLLSPVTRVGRESTSGAVAYTDGAFDKCTVKYNGEKLSVRFVPAVMDPLMEEAAAEAHKEIGRACGITCQMAVDGTLF